MAVGNFHGKPFDEGTLTKLDIFQLYTREWLPVFLSRPMGTGFEVHLFDFFAGPGRDSTGAPGSPLRTLQELLQYSKIGLAGWKDTKIEVHFFDASVRKIKALRREVSLSGLLPAGVKPDIQSLKFTDAFNRSRETLCSSNSAKLLLIDQCGVDTVTAEVFQELVGFPRTDFLFFISSATLNRFRNHPAIKQRIRPVDDYYQVHKAVLEFYRNLLPNNRRYLAPFSIKKGANIYGIIFGSAHPRGIDKFLSVAWKKDQLNGEADFDIHHDGLDPREGLLPLGDVFRPTKVTAFERALDNAIIAATVRDELQVMELCFAHGVTRQHAKPVIKQLKAAHVIEAEFQVPSLDRIESPRPIKLL
jgi:three-Cys-motif partner protein